MGASLVVLTRQVIRSGVRSDNHGPFRLLIMNQVTSISDTLQAIFVTRGIVETGLLRFDRINIHDDLKIKPVFESRVDLL